MTERLERQEALKAATAHRQAGRWREAGAVYAGLLAETPADPILLQLQGSLLIRLGDANKAVELLSRAIEIKADFADALSDLGIALRRLGQSDAALAAYDKALALDPALVGVHYNKANLLRDLGQGDDAVAHYRLALERDPDHIGCLNNLGLALHDLGRFDEALDVYRKGLALAPKSAEIQGNFGNCLKALGCLEEAVAVYRQAVAVNPNFADGWRNLSIVQNLMGDETGALDAINQAIALAPRDAEKFVHQGTLLFKQSRIQEAGVAFRQAIAIAPDYPEAHWNYAHLLMLMGQYRLGWPEYEWRLKCRDLNSYGRVFDSPMWDGAALEGKTLLVHAEQGLGDTLQFARFLTAAKAKGGRVVLECQPELIPLFRRLAGCDLLVAKGDALPPFDLYCPLLSLPHVLGLGTGILPKGGSYLQPPRAARLQVPPAVEGRMRVGLVWAGRPTHRDDRNRSMDLASLAPLVTSGVASFYSLQVGERQADIRRTGLGEAIVDLGEPLTDFAATASAVHQLDLVIAVDTAVAHLAGGMGKTVWTLLPHLPDWRWMLERTDSPWYPSMRLFRQSKRGDWPSVVAEVSGALKEFSRVG